MSVSSVQNVSFKGNECAKPQKKTGGLLPAICSVPVSGLGQLIDGRGRKGAKFFITTYGGYALSGALGVLSLLAAQKNSKVGAVAASFASLATLAIGVVSHIKSVIDGYKGEKSENNIDTQA